MNGIDNINRLIFKSDLSVIDIIGHLIIWILLSLVTLGLGFFVFPYYMVRFIINHTSVLDKQTGNLIGKLKCDIELSSIIGYIILWTFLSIITFGLFYFIFIYKITAHCLNKTNIIEA